MQKDTVGLAQDLLGKVLVYEVGGGKISGRIIETESYLKDDEASHSFCGKTERNAAMFEEAGTVYVYFIYGNHYCLNIVSCGEGIGEAVLIRALEPVSGIDIMKKNRGVENERLLCNGPGKLTQAFGIDRDFNGHKIWHKPLYIIEEKKNNETYSVSAVKRIGIRKNSEALLRFVLQKK